MICVVCGKEIGGGAICEECENLARRPKAATNSSVFKGPGFFLIAVLALSSVAAVVTIFGMGE